MLRSLLFHGVASLALLLTLPKAGIAEDVKVMSFNIRLGSANDKENSWPHRKEFLVETIKAFDPDLLGTQETEKSQKDFLDEQLKGYTSLGVGRVDGKDKGEMMALYYKTARFNQLDGGHFWLSETPEIVGSKSWDSSLPRMVTWVKLQDNLQPNGPPLWFFNTHFDHLGKVARAESAKLIRQRIAELPQGAAVIVTGDFNASEGSEPYQNLFAEKEGSQLLKDTFRLAHPGRLKQEGTFNKFDPNSRDGARIDWIAVTDALSVESARINYVSKEGRVPSDHFPIEVVLKYQKAK